MRIRDEGIRVRPQLLNNTNKLTLNGVFYLGFRINIKREDDIVSFKLQEKDEAKEINQRNEYINDKKLGNTFGNTKSISLQVRDDVSGEMFDFPCSFTVNSTQILGSWTIMPASI